MAGAFQYFSNRKYSEANVMRAYTTKAKLEMIKRSIPHPLRFLIEAIEDGLFKEFVSKDGEYAIASADMQYSYKNYCGSDVKFHRSALTNSLKIHLNLEANKRRTINGRANRRAYVFTNAMVEQALRKYLKSATYSLNTVEAPMETEGACV